MSKVKPIKIETREVDERVSGCLSLDLRHSFLIRLLVLLFLALSVSCIGKRITKANVDEVTEGMSKKQVESILGQPSSSKIEDPSVLKQTIYIYRQGKDTVTIVFRDDKVQSKDSTISN